MRNDGSAENFERLKYKFKLFLEDEHMAFSILMNETERMKEEEITGKWWYEFKMNNNEVDNEVITEEDWDWFNKQLYNTLFLNCDGTPSDQLRSIAEKGREGEIEGVFQRLKGVVGWNVLIRSGIGINGQRMQALSIKVNHPNRISKLSDITRGIELWERNVKEYETITHSSLAS